MSKPENSPFLPYEARLMNMLSNGLEKLETKLDNGLVKLETKVDKNHQEVKAEIKEGFDNVDTKLNALLSKKKISLPKSSMVEVKTETEDKTTNFGRYFKWITGISYDKKLHEYDNKFKRVEFAMANMQIGLNETREDVKKLKSKL